MLEIFHQIADLISSILISVSSNYWLFVFLVFLVCVGEAIFILGLLVPSLPILLLVGGLITTLHLDFWPIYFAATLGGVVGDALSYWIGHLFRDRIKTVWPFKNYLPLIERGEVFFQRHGGKAIFIGRFITGLKAVVPGIAGMLGMRWTYFTLINVISAFVWSASHILPGMFLTEWLKSIGLSLELVILFGAIILIALALLVHYWKRIVLLFTPYLGEFGKSLEARWRKPKTEETAG
ncbi:MAG TPA: DedA family protein [Devosia sp.]|jgi:undecaprenyl-diphosphatase|nr:DedA family protein [Devosia sp.]